MASPRRVSSWRAALGGTALFITEGIQASLGNPSTGATVEGQRGSGQRQMLIYKQSSDHVVCRSSKAHFCPQLGDWGSFCTTRHCTGPRRRGRIPRVNLMSYIFSTNCMSSTGLGTEATCQGNRHVSVLEDPKVLGGGRPRNRSSVEGPERTWCQKAVGP